ncbi:MAG: CPBP family intramembrane metalloprotease [Prevotellaceae bacterium]|nr:CPBP family intramembrane metalloprotease [Candidatus Colivivens equi]
MNKSKVILNIVLVLAIYFIIQVACTFAFVIPQLILSNYNNSSLTDFSNQFNEIIINDTGWILIISSIITSLILILIKKIKLPDDFSCKRCSWKYVPYILFASIVGILACNILSEYLNLPNTIQDTIIDMIDKADGILAIAIIGPAAEEILFRGAICEQMLRSGAKPWTAILVSALIFGIVHLNPAQIPFATILGIMFGILYYKTKSLIPSIILHIINNSLAVLMIIKYKDSPDMTLTDIFGTYSTPVIMIVGLGISIFMYQQYFIKKQ